MKRVFACWVAALCCVGAAGLPAVAGNGRSSPVGVVDCRAFTGSGDPERGHADHAGPLFEWLAAQNLHPAWVPVEIFLPDLQAQRDAFQRIVIPWNAELFTPEMYAGMRDYVKNGGLLISNALMLYVDSNRNYRLDEEDRMFLFAHRNRPRALGRIFDTLGVYGHRFPVLKSLRAEVRSPLTMGMPRGEDLLLPERAVVGREIRNHSALVVVTALRRNRDGSESRQPAVTIRNEGHGNCLYIVPRFDAAQPAVLTLFTNAFSAATLDWLTAGE